MICTVKWNFVTDSQYVQEFSAIKGCTLLQSHTYACAVSKIYNQRPLKGLIEINGQKAGLVQAMQVGILKNMLHAIIVDRGPLWFDGFGNEDHFKAFIEAYNRDFPQRFGRRRRFIPEIKKSPDIDAIMKANGFTKKPAAGYQTIWLDITQDKKTLRANLRKSWRQSLQKAEKSPLTIIWDDAGAKLPWLLKAYDLDRKQRGYDGPDLPVLQALGTAFSLEKNSLIGVALLDNRPVGAILTLCHGDSATYQIGWTSEDGRKYCAHHRLLWELIEQLKTKNIKNFDLGGVNDETAKSIKTFKSGMGGRLVELAGLYT